MKSAIIIPIVCVVLFSACQYGNHVTQTSHPVAALPCNTTVQNVFLFFENEKIDFEYKRKAVVEVIGNEWSNDAELINRLKYQAGTHCANAIINVQSEFITREAGVVGGEEKDKRTYTAKVYRGIAVEMPEADYRSGKYGDWQDKSYSVKVQQYHESEIKQVKFKFVATTLLVIGGLIFVLANG